jgi:phytoene desaturase
LSAGLKRAVIIGGGLGGLSVALRLQAAGWHATVCEAGPTFGGKMNRWSKAGFHFDTGPSLITMPWVFRDAFAAAGGRLEEHVELKALDPLAEYRFDDGTSFEYTSVLPDWLVTLKRVAPDDQNGFFRFLEMGAKLFAVSEATFFRRSPFEAPSPGEWRALKNMPLRYAWGNYQSTVESFFQSPYLRQLYGRYPTYVGSSPWLSPATLAVIPYIEFAFGGYAVKGGLYRIVEGLLALAKQNGVELLTDARVTRIVKSGGAATGVELASGETLPADVVIMNGDHLATAELLGSPARPALRNRSMSGFVQLFGLRTPLRGIHQHTVCFSADYKTEFSQIFDQQRFPDDPTVYVNAPEPGDTLFIMANAPATDDVWDEPRIAQARGRVMERLRKAGFPDFQEHVAVSDVWTPSRIAERYLMPGGAIYGADSHGWKNAFLRPRNANPELRGLYHVGGSTHPGGGTPTVLMSAEITARIIRQRHP